VNHGDVVVQGARLNHLLQLIYADNCSSHLIFTFTWSSIIRSCMLPVVKLTWAFVYSLVLREDVLKDVTSVVLFSAIWKFGLGNFSTFVTHSSNLDIITSVETVKDTQILMDLCLILCISRNVCNISGFSLLSVSYAL
jgi:hypothetical protein